MVQLKIFQFLRFGTILILQVSTPQNGQMLHAFAEKLFECVWPFCEVAA